MPNHIHLILVPDRAEALGRALGETHRRYSGLRKRLAARSARRPSSTASQPRPAAIPAPGAEGRGRRAGNWGVSKVSP
jgi:hypothetical protein